LDNSGPLFKEKEKKKKKGAPNEWLPHYHPFILPFEDLFFLVKMGV
jgi:hypothetical protein